MEEKSLDKKKIAEEMGLVVPKNFTDTVMNTVKQYENEGQLVLPTDYNVGNAMKSAYLTLQSTKDKSGKPFMEVCTKDSIARALLDMVVQGLDVGQKQCYFIVRGNELTLMRSYFGSQLALRRMTDVKDVWATVIYEGDEVEQDIYEGETIISKHITKFGNQDNNILGAYAVIEMKDGRKKYTIMTKKEIDTSWSKSSSSAHTVHKEFPQEMAKRTVINRACKNLINTDTKNQLLANSFNRTTENEYLDYDIEDEEPQEEKISKEQIIELATLTGDDTSKLEIIHEKGYNTINDIRKEDYEEIKNLIANVSTQDNK